MTIVRRATIPVIGEVNVTICVYPPDDSGPREEHVIRVEKAGEPMDLRALEDLSVGTTPMLEWLAAHAE